jgi:nucleotide-binding universal stress UspA family protein
VAERTILVPMDGSAFARTVLGVLGSLFEPATVRLVLLRVGETPAHVGAPPERRTVTPDILLPEIEPETQVWDSQEWESARQRLRDDLAADARRLQRDGWSVEIATAFGDPAEEIVAWSRDHEPDLVAMATHGRSGLSRALLGSVAERALRRLAVPVLLHRPEEIRARETDPAVEAATEPA